MAEPEWKSDYLPFWIGGAIRGRVRGDVVPCLRGMSEIDSAEVGLSLREQVGGPTSAAELRAACRARSRALQSVAHQLRRAGLIADWRNEASALLDEQGAELARCERGAFRTLGLQNRAVHINGWHPDGRLWVARRSALKRADPGKLDNLAAGGVGAGETPRRCALRELWEEAGVSAAIARRVDFPGMAIRSLRETTLGLHDELVIVADLVLPADFEPNGRDGEVESFACLDRAAVEAALDGGEFTVEAALATRESLDRRAPA
ncbi:MAG: NUDIX hydrolase [Phycisphaerales bacterium]